MKLVCYYNKNLKMSEGKLAAQVGHVCKELGKVLWAEYGNPAPAEDTIIVLGLRQNKFMQEMEETSSDYNFHYVQKDLGLTEVEEGSVTAFGYIQE